MVRSIAYAVGNSEIGVASALWCVENAPGVCTSGSWLQRQIVVGEMDVVYPEIMDSVRAAGRNK